MSFFKSHVFLMFIYAVASGVFFAFLWRNEPRERVKFFVLIFVSLFIGGIILSWLMFPFPVR